MIRNKATRAIALLLATSGVAQASLLEEEIRSAAPFKSIEEMPVALYDSEQVRINPAYPQVGELPLQVQKSEEMSVSREITNRGTAGGTPTPAERSGCPNLALNSAVYTAFTAQGQIQCYSVEVTESIKIDGLLVNIPSGVDYNLFFFKLEDDNSFTSLDVSNAPSATTEKTIKKVEPGIYILAAQSTQGVSNDKAIMGWFGRTEFDQHEANDRANQSTPISGITSLQGNIDNDSDLDFFTYNTGADQSKLRTQFNGSTQFSFEVWAGSGWATIPHNQLADINVTPNSSVTFLVKGVAGNIPPASVNYSLSMVDPSAGTKLSGTRAWNNENLTNLLHASYLEAHQKIGLSGKVTNDADQAVPHAKVLLRAVVKKSNDEVEVIGQKVVDSGTDGKFSATVDLPDCTSSTTVRKKNRVFRGSPTNPEVWWDITYRAAAYQMFPLDGDNKATTNFNHAFMHICKERIYKSCYWQRDFRTGKEEYKCNLF